MLRRRSGAGSSSGPPGWGAARGEYLSLKVLRQRKRLRSVGARPGIPHGDVAQRPGTFVVDASGITAFAHYNQDSTDNPSVEAVIDAVAAVAPARPSFD